MDNWELYRPMFAPGDPPPGPQVGDLVVICPSIGIDDILGDEPDEIMALTGVTSIVMSIERSPTSDLLHYRCADVRPVLFADELQVIRS